MTQARTPEEKIDQLLTLRARVEAEIEATLAKINAEPLKRRSKYVIPECGTESSYQRHHRRGEKCEECKAAHRLHERVKYARRICGNTNPPVDNSPSLSARGTAIGAESAALSDPQGMDNNDTPGAA